MPSMFRAARQNRIFQDVVDQIQEAIFTGRLEIGERLPAERDLKEMLQTSRSTLREALRVLEQKGLIEIRLGVGGGARVRAASADQVSESLDLLIRSQRVSLAHLAEFRRGVEGDVVAIAAARADAGEMSRVHGLLERARACTEAGAAQLDRFLQVDKEFHLAFAHIAGNPIYLSVMKMVHDNIHRYYERFLMMEDLEMIENYQDLQGIAGAVERGEADRARRLAQAHVQRFNRYMQAHARAAGGIGSHRRGNATR